MAKLNKRFKFIKEVSKETYYANIYSSLDDMEDNQPVLKADIVLDESTTIPGYIQGSRSRYDDDLLDVYVAPTNGQADFRLNPVRSNGLQRVYLSSPHQGTIHLMYQSELREYLLLQ